MNTNAHTPDRPCPQAHEHGNLPVLSPQKPPEQKRGSHSGQKQGHQRNQGHISGKITKDPGQVLADIPAVSDPDIRLIRGQVGKPPAKCFGQGRHLRVRRYPEISMIPHPGAEPQQPGVCQLIQPHIDFRGQLQRGQGLVRIIVKKTGHSKLLVSQDQGQRWGRAGFIAGHIPVVGRIPDAQGQGRILGHEHPGGLMNGGPVRAGGQCEPAVQGITVIHGHHLHQPGGVRGLYHGEKPDHFRHRPVRPQNPVHQILFRPGERGIGRERQIGGQNMAQIVIQMPVQRMAETLDRHKPAQPHGQIGGEKQGKPLVAEQFPDAHADPEHQTSFPRDRVFFSWHRPARS
ncbi:MAG: hypothetical protein U5K27_20125 [Desulfotignum sp.]|nr:hypothetical protein [Desulfotignum sp.]